MMQSTSASMARPSSPLKNSHGPSLIGGGGFPAFGAQGNLPAIVAALTVVALNSSMAVPARNSLRRRPIIVGVPCFIFSSSSVHRAGTSMSFRRSETPPRRSRPASIGHDRQQLPVNTSPTLNARLLVVRSQIDRVFHEAGAFPKKHGADCCEQAAESRGKSPVSRTRCSAQRCCAASGARD